jgi:lysophospholipase L1-like esterase
VRDRLQARFGDAGPGFLAVAVDPRWALRPGIARWTQGDWESLGITFGGAPTAAYGLAGTLATARAEASATLGGRKLGEQDGGDRQLVHRIDVYYQRQPGGGTLSVKPKGAPGATLRTDSGSDRTADAFHMLTSPQGSPTVWIKADGGGPVTVYGVALETAGPGLTWESFGVAGSGQGSILTNQSARHLAGQVARRQPHLVVYQTGGNELGYPSLKQGAGELYLETYGKVLARLRAGAPDAACLVVTPLDQATRERGQVVSKPMLTRMVALQEQAATEAGCAFWDARGAMGGEGAFARWLDHEPRMAWTDLMHLTDEGLEIIGHGLADAIEASYDQWRRDHPERFPPPYVTPPPPAL